MKAPTFIIDHNDERQHSRFLGRAAGLKGKGPYVWTCKPWKPKRSNKANRFVWGALVERFVEYNAAQGQHYTDDEAFVILKRENLPPGGTYTSRKTGEVIQLPARSSELDVTEFSDFIEECLAYLAQLGIPVDDLVANKSRE